MKPNRRAILISVLALLFQCVPAGLLWWISAAAYSDPPRLPETWEHPVSMLALLFSGLASWTLASIGACGLLTRCRSATAAVVMLFCNVPAWLCGAVYLHALAVFRAML